MTDEKLESVCPRCGEPHDAQQEYCLECGARLPGSYALAPGSRWTDNPNWLYVGLVALLVVALVAGAIAAVAASGDDEGGAGGTSGVSGTLAGTTGFLPGVTGIVPLPLEPPPADTSFLPGGEVVDGAGAETGGGGGAEPPPGEEPAAAGLITWPAETSGFTIVLSSIAEGGGARAGAEQTAQEAIAAGLPEVGILDSSDFSSLNPGYIVVFTGVYATIGDAEAGLDAARSAGFPVAYVREVAP